MTIAPFQPVAAEPRSNAPQAARRIIIAIDGPAGSGKSTTARLVAARLGYVYIDTGAMYRALTLAALRQGLGKNGSPVSDEAITSLLERYSVRLAAGSGETTAASAAPVASGAQRTYLCVGERGEDVSEEIRSQEVTAFVSAVSALPSAREAMARQQRAMGEGGGVVMDGRDIGTVVFPRAELKIFLVASIEERAGRRLRELEAKGSASGDTPSIDDLRAQIQERDRQDSERSIAPLKKAPDAVEIDTSSLSIEEQTERIVALAQALKD